MTNYEKNKFMSVDEMAKMLCDKSECYNGCIAFDLCDIREEPDYNGFIKWLESEVEGNE